MIRDILFGGLCFAAGYAIGKQLPGLKADIERYDRLRAMSDEPPVMREVGERVTGLFSILGHMMQTQGIAGPLTSVLRLVPGLDKDVDRYTRLRAM